MRIACSRRSWVGPRAQDEHDRPGAGGQHGARGRERQRQGDVVFAAHAHAAREVRRAQQLGHRGAIGARQRRRQHLAVHPEGDVAAGDLLQLRGERVVEEEADAQRAEDFRVRLAERDRHRDELEHAVGLRQQADALVAGERFAHRRLAGDDERAPMRRADRGEHRAGLVGDEQQVRVELPLIAVGGVLHRRRIVGVDGRLELRRVGDEARHHREGLRPRRPELIDEGAGRLDVALERGLGLARHAAVDEVDRDANGEDGEQRARQENPAPQRREEPHRSVKSSSATPPSGTVIGRVSDEMPSFHAITP